MEEKLQFVPSLKDAFAIGVKKSCADCSLSVALARNRMDSVR